MLGHQLHKAVTGIKEAKIQDQKEVMNIPRGDGRGPRGQGPGTGTGLGRGRAGRGRGGGFAEGAGGLLHPCSSLAKGQKDILNKSEAHHVKIFFGRFRTACVSIR